MDGERWPPQSQGSAAARHAPTHPRMAKPLETRPPSPCPPAESARGPTPIRPESGTGPPKAGRGTRPPTAPAMASPCATTGPLVGRQRAFQMIEPRRRDRRRGRCRDRHECRRIRQGRIRRAHRIPANRAVMTPDPRKERGMSSRRPDHGKALRRHRAAASPGGGYRNGSTRSNGGPRQATMSLTGEVDDSRPPRLMSRTAPIGRSAAHRGRQDRGTVSPDPGLARSDRGSAWPSAPRRPQPRTFRRREVWAERVGRSGQAFPHMSPERLPPGP